MENERNSNESKRIVICPQHGEYETRILTCLGIELRTRCPECDIVFLRELQEKEEENRKALEFEAAKIPSAYKNATIAELDITSDNKEAINSAKAFALAFKDGQKTGQGFIFCGFPGTGKTHIAAALCRAVINFGGSARFVSCFDLFTAIKASYNMRQEAMDDPFRPFIYPDLLVVDEVRSSSITVHDSETFFQVIEKRNLKGKSTIITTNMPPMDLSEKIGASVIDRITSRGGKIIPFRGASFRK